MSVIEAWQDRAAELETEVYALYLAIRDSRTPFVAKIVIVLVVGYAVSPIDPIPDFIPGLGYLDELVVLPIGALIALWLVPDHIMDECRQRATEEIDAGRTRWIAAGIVLLIWISIGALLARTVTTWL